MIEKVIKKGVGYLFTYNSKRETLNTTYVFKEYFSKLKTYEERITTIEVELKNKIATLNKQRDKEISYYVKKDKTSPKIKDINKSIDDLISVSEIKAKNNIHLINKNKDEYITDIKETSSGALFVYIHIDRGEVSNYVESDSDILLKVKTKLGAYIYSYYSADKQSRDSSNMAHILLNVKAYLQEESKSSGSISDELLEYIDIEKYLLNTASNIKNKNDLDEVLNDTPIVFRDWIRALLKITIRLNWINACKKELYSHIENNTPVVYPKFIEV